MNALEERQKTIVTTAQKNKRHLVIKPSRSLFKVVVNNYKQLEKPINKDKIDETMMDHHQGMPAQSSGYLKFPEYDWF